MSFVPDVASGKVTLLANNDDRSNGSILKEVHKLTKTFSISTSGLYSYRGTIVATTTTQDMLMDATYGDGSAPDANDEVKYLAMLTPATNTDNAKVSIDNGTHFYIVLRPGEACLVPIDNRDADDIKVYSVTGSQTVHFVALVSP